MKRSLPYFAILICAVLGTFTLQHCGSTKAKKPRASPTPKVSLTSVHVAFNISTNDYGTVTAQRIIKDTLVLSDSTDENSDMVKAKDTSYLLWILSPVLDSSKNHVKRKIPNPDKTFSDSLTGKWMQAQKQMILQDFNKTY